MARQRKTTAARVLLLPIQKNKQQSGESNGKFTQFFGGGGGEGRANIKDERRHLEERKVQICIFTRFRVHLKACAD